MAAPSQNGTQRRANPFARTTPTSPTAVSSPKARPQSAIFAPASLSSPQSPSHSRHQSYNSFGNIIPTNGLSTNTRVRQNSKSSTAASNTFAPSFIKTEDMRRGSEAVKGIEGENDFSGKRYVWLKDPQMAFVKGWIVEDLENNRILVQCDDGSVCLRVPYYLTYLL